MAGPDENDGRPFKSDQTAEAANNISDIRPDLPFPGYSTWVFPGTVKVIETHISRIFLTDKFAYKQKKPVNFGFVDYTGLAGRMLLARRELSLNRRACSGIYVDLVELRFNKNKVFAGFKGGKLVDVLVRMKRVDTGMFLDSILKSAALTDGVINTPSELLRESVSPEETNKKDSSCAGKDKDEIRYILEKVAKRIYLFHKSARTSKRISSFGSLKIYEGNWDDNFKSLEGLFGQGKKIDLLKRLEKAYLDFLSSRLFEEFIRSRAKNGFVRDVHGDLRMEHVAVTGRCRVNGICIMDCVEFDERYRCQDIYLDISFLLMDFERNGFFYESLLFFGFYKSFFNYRDSIEPYEKYEYAIINFFKAYRAIVRTKIALLSNKKNDADDYLALAAFYFSALERPFVIINCGLPGSGKSVLSGILSVYFRALIFSSDKIRNDFYGFEDKDSRYAIETGEAVYREMTGEGIKALDEGKNVIFDATFTKKSYRERIIREFSEKDCIFITVYSKIYDESEETVLGRLDKRNADSSDFRTAKGAVKDYSEAGRGVYREMKKGFQEPSERELDQICESRRVFITVDAAMESGRRFNAVMDELRRKTGA